MVEAGGGFGGHGDALGAHPVKGVSRADDAVVLHLTGEVDLYNANLVREALARSVAGGPSRVVVDLSEVTFIDSTGLGVLVETRKSLPHQARLLLAAPSFEARRALEVSGLHRHFAVHATVGEALDAKD